MKNEIVIFENQKVKLEVNMKEETVWLTQEQMVKLFERDQSVISRHLKNIFKEGELEESSNMQKMHNAKSDKPVLLYNLDVIISVGYRVKSKNGIIFRKWATSILKEHMIKGYTANEQRLKYLEKTVQLLDIANRNFDHIKPSDSKEVLRVINDYTKALNLLDDYDHKTLVKPKGHISKNHITYKECINIIESLKFNEQSDIFALERDKGLESVINNIYQTFDGKDIYSTLEEKAANFLYLIVKNHIFIDGNKRVAATLFIYFLQFYKLLYQNNRQIIDNNTLAALTLLIAQSNPKEKEIMVDLIMNFLT